MTVGVADGGTAVAVAVGVAVRTGGVFVGVGVGVKNFPVISSVMTGGGSTCC